MWIGYGFASASTPWVELGKRGVLRVVYQCEPEHRCSARTVGRYAVDELWDFAWHNFEPCQSAPTPPRLRYVPLGTTSMHEGQPIVPMPLLPHGPGPLMFFGNVRDGPPRRKCFTELRRLLGPSDVQHTFRVWNHTSFRSLLRRSAVFVNLHKECASESLRLSLSHFPLASRPSAGA